MSHSKFGDFVDISAHIVSLYNACRDGNVEEVKVLLAQGTNANHTIYSGRTPLFIASQKGHVEVVKVLLALDGIDVNVPLHISHHAPLYVACKNGHVEIVRLLLEHDGINVNQYNGYGNTALLLACKMLENVKGWEKDRLADMSRKAIHDTWINIIEMLLTRGSNVNHVNVKGETPLFVACQKGHIVVVKMLLGFGRIGRIGRLGRLGLGRLGLGHLGLFQDGLGHLGRLGRLDIDVNHVRKGWSSLCIACEKGYVEIVIVLLANTDIDVNLALTENRNSGTTALYIACEKGSVKIAKALLAHTDIDVNKARNFDGTTPLCIASQKGFVEIVKALLAHTNMDANRGKGNGETPLYIACEKGCVEIVDMLLTNGVNVNKPNSNGWTPLLIACQAGHTIIVKMLFAHNVDVNQGTMNGFTPLLIAVQHGHVEVVKLLLAQDGIDIAPKMVKNMDGLMFQNISPLYIACQNARCLSNTNMVEVLLAHNVDIDLDNALCVACERGHLKIIKVLLAHGRININFQRDDGATPLLCASVKNFIYGSMEPRYMEVILYIVFHGAVMEGQPKSWNWPSVLVDCLISIHDVVYTAILAFRTCCLHANKKEEGVTPDHALGAMSIHGMDLVHRIENFLVPRSKQVRGMILHFVAMKKR
jgi:ankyrin repeat protein